MIDIRLMSENEYHYIADWNAGKDEDFLFQWAGHTAYVYPITTDQIRTRANEKDTRLYIILSDGEPVGSVELVLSDETKAKVCRFILCDEARNKGNGTSVLKKLAEIAAKDMGLEKLVLGVFCFNTGAIRCYEKSGFLVKKFRRHEDPGWNSFTMELSIQ